MNSRLQSLLKSKNFLVFVVSFFIIAIFSGKILPDPFASRVMAIRALVEHGTFSTNNITDMDTVDKFYYDGNFYSSKPPLIALVGAGIYLALKTATGLPFNLTFYYIICLLTTGLAFAFTMMYFYKSLRWFEINEGHKIMFTGLLGFCTLFFPYSTVLHNHTIAAFFVFLAFYNILLIKFQGNKNIYYIMAGFFFSLAIVTEPTQAAIIYMIFCLYLLLNKNTRKKTYLFLAAAVPIGVLYMLYNLRTTGSILPPYFHFDTLYKYPGSYWLNPIRTDALNHSKPFYIFNMLIGAQGVFLYSPVLIFGFWGMIKAIKDKNKVWTDMAKLILASCVVVLTFLGITTYNYGGACYGFRWFIICMPIVMFFVPILTPYLKSKKFTATFLAVAFISFIFSFIGIPGNWTSEIFTISGTRMYFPLLESLIFQFHNLIRV